MTLSTIETTEFNSNVLGFMMSQVVKKDTIDFVLDELSNKAPVRVGTNKVYTVIITKDGYVGISKRNLSSGKRDKYNCQIGVSVAAIRLARYLHNKRKEIK